MFPTTSSQEELYASVAAPIVDGCFNGIHGCVFVYGQTGSGKTFTMNGPTASFAAGSFTAEAGLIPRAMQAIYERKESSGEGAGTCVVAASLWTWWQAAILQVPVCSMFSISRLASGVHVFPYISRWKRHPCDPYLPLSTTSMPPPATAPI